MLLRLWLSLVLLVAASAALTAELSPLTIHTTSGDRIFQVEVVDTPRSRAQGLMFREHMPPEQGMLFDFQREQHVSFWMKNTLIPLDMIFADAQGRITHIHHNAVPHDLTGIPSGGRILGVLEVNGGLARLLGIRIGDQISHPMFDVE